MPTIDADAHVIESERTWNTLKIPNTKPQLTMPMAAVRSLDNRRPGHFGAGSMSTQRVRGGS